MKYLVTHTHHTDTLGFTVNICKDLYLEELRGLLREKGSQ